MITGNNEKKHSYIMTETIFAGKQVKKLSLPKRSAIFTFSKAIFPGFTKYLFMSNGPCNTCNGNS